MRCLECIDNELKYVWLQPSIYSRHNIILFSQSCTSAESAALTMFRMVIYKKLLFIVVFRFIGYWPHTSDCAVGHSQSSNMTICNKIASWYCIVDSISGKGIPRLLACGCCVRAHAASALDLCLSTCGLSVTLAFIFSLFPLNPKKSKRVEAIAVTHE